MPFGDAGPEPGIRGYRHLLLRERPGDCDFDRLHDPTIGRPSVTPFDKVGPQARRQARYVAMLGFAAKDLATLRFPLVAETLPTPNGLNLLESESSTRDGLTSAVWQDGADVYRRVGLVAEWSPDLESAIDLAAWRLTFYRESMAATRSDAFPDAVVFAASDGGRMVVVYANAVVRLRKAPDHALPPLSVFGQVLAPVLVPPA
jgi:hypothetical protein